jgi:hypothetical protein
MIEVDKPVGLRPPAQGVLFSRPRWMPREGNAGQVKLPGLITIWEALQICVANLIKIMGGWVT